MLKWRVSKICHHFCPSAGLPLSLLLQVCYEQYVLGIFGRSLLTVPVVAETIALSLCHADAPRPYLYCQIFAGLSYVVASGFMLELWRVLRRRQIQDRQGQPRMGPSMDAEA